MKPAEMWAGEFGEEYLKRNRVDWRKRIPTWEELIDFTGARSVSEFGCNAGWNLSAIKRAYPDVQVYGTEINQAAIAQARHAGLDVSDPFDYLYQIPRAELTFTAGVLIHIPPADLEPVMANIAAASYDFVIAIEYESHTGEEEEVTYRGNDGMLWRRDYGTLYESLGLETLLKAKVDSRDGFDDCTVWLMKKP